MMLIDMNTVDVALVSFFLTLIKFCFFVTVSYVKFELVNNGWEFVDPC